MNQTVCSVACCDSTSAALGSLRDQVSNFVRDFNQTIFGGGSVEEPDLDLERGDPALETVRNRVTDLDIEHVRDKVAGYVEDLESVRDRVAGFVGERRGQETVGGVSRGHALFHEVLVSLGG